MQSQPVTGPRDEIQPDPSLDRGDRHQGDHPERETTSGTARPRSAKELYRGIQAR